MATLVSQADQYLPQQQITWLPYQSKTTTTYSDTNNLTPRFGLKNNLKIASFHDIHLGHRRTLAPYVIKGFNPILANEAEIATWDILVIPGDLFDRLLFLTDPFLEDILVFLSKLLMKCAKYDVLVRILEGTPGHDHKQSGITTFVDRILKSISEQYNVDLKHVSELSIEYIEKFNINMLYVPDEWHPDVTETYDEVRKLMSDRGLTQVDFCLLHGAFNYQIDANLNPKAHNEELWSNLVKYYIFAGHVHFASQYKNILVAGSFDRLAHGEEQPKGWLTVEITDLDEHRIIFHENQLATKYVTIDVRGKQTEEIIKMISEYGESLPEHSHIRLFALETDTINDGLKTIKQRFTNYYFTIKIDNKEKQSRQRSLKVVNEKFEAITLNRENIERIVKERVATLPNVNSDQVMNTLMKYL